MLVGWGGGGVLLPEAQPGAVYKFGGKSLGPGRGKSRLLSHTAGLADLNGLSLLAYHIYSKGWLNVWFMGFCCFRRP